MRPGARGRKGMRLTGAALTEYRRFCFQEFNCAMDGLVRAALVGQALALLWACTAVSGSLLTNLVRVPGAGSWLR